ncbi:MAG: M56 family metallopeptidase [Lachnospiraceae bacterium]|jgi:beta-lactamase regulating signal transducer with metallopeptidase domain|nr:M56 family metallopeptidase [Lachnospiraceae bacterium]
MIFVLGFVRLAFPFEFRIAREIRMWKFYPSLQMLAYRKVFLGITVAGILGIIWLGGILVLLVAYFKRMYDLRKIIQSAVPIEEFEHLHESFEKAVRSLGYQGNVRIAITEEFLTPVSVGVFHPIVLIPKEILAFSDMEQYGVIRHEVTHYLRGDIGKKRALDVLQCIFWWNPVVYYLKRSVVEMLELECDDRVCKGMSDEEQLAYFEAIKHVLTIEPNKKKTLDLGMGYAVSHTGKFLRRRFLEILKPVPKQSSLVTGFLALISVVLFCLSYSFVLQPAGLPNDLEENHFDFGYDGDKSSEYSDFLIKITDGSYLYVSDMVGKEIISEQDISSNPLYSDLPVFEKISEGRD